MAKPASVVVSTVLSVVLAVSMVPSSADAAQQVAPADQPENNPGADEDAVLAGQNDSIILNLIVKRRILPRRAISEKRRS